ncbi:sulfatase [Lentisphaerota bacterium WC36G]|nr:sulfatase [Lentisphaerae bacterium WC36]
MKANKKVLNCCKTASIIALTATSVVNSSPATAAEQRITKNSKPNVIFIFPDQLRRSSMGFWNKQEYAKYLQGAADPVVTPNFDQFAAQGIVLNRAVSNYPVCSPYRGMLLTGAYPSLSGITQNCKTSVDDSINTKIASLPMTYKNAGYSVGYFGKCHWLKTEPHFDKKGNFVGTTDKPGGHYINKYDTFVPAGKNRLGIDYFFQTIKDSHFTPYAYSSDPKLVNGKKDGEMFHTKQFSAKTEAEALIEYIKNNRNQRIKGEPFFAMWAANPPHPPCDMKNTYMEFYNKYYSPEKIPNKDLLFTRGNVNTERFKQVRSYFANVSAVDKYFGQVMKALKEAGLEENTIVVLTSDHGEMLGSHNLTGKPQPYTEAFGIPFIIRYPEKLQHRVDDLILSAPDVMPTLLGLSDIKVPATVQGHDYSKQLIDPNAGVKDRPKYAAYYTMYSSNKIRGVYSGDFTLVINLNGKNELKEAYMFNNKIDPYQLKKYQFNDYPKESKAMLRFLAKHLKDTDDVWYKNKVAKDLIPYN